MPRAIDANLILRYLLDDPEAPRVEKLLKDERKKLILPDVVVAEVVWVLDSFYKWDRKKIAQFVTSLLHLETIQSNEALLTAALDIFRDKKVDFVDAYLASLAHKGEIKGVYSFDKDFDKIPKVRRLEPR